MVGTRSTHENIFDQEINVKTMLPNHLMASHQFEENITLLETMAHIKKLTLGRSFKNFAYDVILK